MNKLILEGKEYTLSDELIEKIKAEVKEQGKIIAPFERISGNRYFFIEYDSIIEENIDDKSDFDNKLFAIGNYCTNKEMIQQQAMRETLNRLLWRYSIEHEGEIICYGLDYLYEISYNIRKHEFEVMWTNTRIDEGAVLFKKEETARNAIEEVIKPFLNGHPDFNYFRW